MKKIGLISDTHHFIHPRIYEHFKDCDKIWHAGDIGNIGIADELNKFKPFKAVYGNIDGQDVRVVYPRDQIFICEGVKVFMTHIGGYPGRYPANIKAQLMEIKPKLFICGHSHILKIIYDKKFDFLHINPGAAGRYGFHQVITLLKFDIDGKDIKNMKIIEIER